MTTCPAPDRLALWVDERLAPADHAALSAHVDACPHCQAALDRLTADPPRANGTAADARVSALLVRLKETVPAAPDQPPVGDLPAVPGYDVLEPVGRGGMGAVYRARQHGVNREVAVKLLHRPAPDGDDAARFRREGEVLGRLAHPNVVQVYEVGVADGRPFLVMEYVPGGPLSRLAAGRPLPPAAAAGLVEQVARAVQHAHDHGVLHRDLKPANILVSSKFQVPSSKSEDNLDLGTRNLELKVTDFGLARPLDAGESLTQTGVIVGTPSYMAPEQVGGDQRLTAACDVYGLGAVLYELLTGRPPFTGTNPADVLLQVRDQDPVAPSRVIPTLPRDLNTVCLKCLEKDPQRRYPSAGAVAEDLRRWRAGEPIQARPTGTAERAWKWARRRKAAAALVGVGLFLLVVGLPTVTGLWLWADTERRRADKAGRETAGALGRAERSLYAAHIAQAELHYRLNDLTRTRFHLAACEPAPGRPDPRGWEWDYLRGLAYSEHVDLPAPARTDGRARTLYGVAYSSDGRLLAAGGGVRSYLSYTGTEPGEFRVWDAATGRPVFDPPGPEPLAVTAAAFGPAGRLFTVQTDVWFNSTRLTLMPPVGFTGPPGLFRAWDLAAGTVAFEQAIVPQVRGQGASPQHPALAVRPDGSRVAVGTAGGVRVYDGRTGGTVFDCPGAVAAGFDRTGARLLVYGPEQRWSGWLPFAWVTAYDPAAGAVQNQRPVGLSPAFLVAFSPSGGLLVRLTHGSEVIVTPTAGDDPEYRLPIGARSGEVSALAVSPDDTLLATGGPDGTVRVWELPSGRSRQVFRSHADRVTAVVFDPTGSRVVSVGWDRATKVWDLTRQPEFAAVGGNPPPGEARAEDCAFTTDGRELLVIRAPGGLLERWDTGKDRLLGPPVRLDLTADKLAIPFPGRLAAFAAGGRRLVAVSGADPTVVKVWDTVTGTELAALAGCRLAVRFVGTSADARRVAATAWVRGEPGRPADLVVWDADRPAAPRRVPLDGQTCPALAVSADGRWLAAAVRANVPGEEVASCRVRVWDLDADREAADLDAGAEVSALTFDGPGGRLAAATGAPRVLIWETGSWAQRHAIPCLEAYAHLAFAPDGRRLAGANRELLTLWDPAAGEEMLTLRGRPRRGVDLPFNPRVVFDPSGTKVAVVQNDFTLHIWTAAGYSQRKE